MNRILEWFNKLVSSDDKFVKTPAEADIDNLRVELQMHYDRVATIEGLLDIDGTKEAYALANQMQLDLFEKRKHPTPLTDNEKFLKSLFTKKKDCNHLKGGWAFRFGWNVYKGMSMPNKDYNVSRHTFPDSSTYIKCLSCGKTWYPKDRGWKKAVEMTQQSTNHASMSEQMPVRHKYDRIEKV